MTTKTIAQMIAEFPPESENTFAMLLRAQAEVQLLRAALIELLDSLDRVEHYTPSFSRGINLQVALQNANKVLEVTKP
jgi:hypothetical protein